MDTDGVEKRGPGDDRGSGEDRGVEIPKWNDWSYQRRPFGALGRGYPPCFCVCRGNKGVTGEWLASRGNKGVSGRKSEEEAKNKGVGRSEMAQEQRPAQHNRRSIAHYLPFVYYYLVGTSFETGTRPEWETPRPSLSPRGRGTQSLVRVYRWATRQKQVSFPGFASCSKRGRPWV